MSQRGGLPPRPPSQSPQNQASAALSDQHPPTAQHDIPVQSSAQDVGSVAGPGAADRSRPASSRSLGISGLIHPSEKPDPGAEPKHHETVASPGIGRYSQQGTPVAGPLPFAFTGQQPQHQALPPPSHHQPDTPGTQAASTPYGLTPTERRSPASGFPFPALNNPRPTHSPQPRTMSLAVAGPSRAGDFHAASQAQPVGGGSLKRPYPKDLEAPPGSPSPAGGASFARPLPTFGQTTAPSTSTKRAVSQPVTVHIPPGGQPGPTQIGPQERTPGTVATVPAGVASWSGAHPLGTGPGGGTELYRSLRSGVVTGDNEGQLMLKMASGEDGEAFDVVVDRRHASRQADEKRQRNAHASARFRQRKKEQQMTLDQENRELKEKVQSLFQERDFYRAERHRLQDLLSQTALRDQAAGPPSPIMTAAPFHMVEPHAMGAAAVGAHQSRGRKSYPSSESSAERPARRRRTSGAPEFTAPTYGPPPTGLATSNLPPISGQPYGSMRGESPAIRPGERLPPLRAVEGHLGPGGPGSGPDLPLASPGGPPGPGGAPYPSYGRVPHETGWASHPSGQPGNPPGHVEFRGHQPPTAHHPGPQGGLR